MSKHDESRRAFLIGGATVGAGAVTGLVPDALAQTHAQQHAAPDAPATTAQAHAHAGGHGTFLNDDDVATVEAFAERIMPGAPGAHHEGGARMGSDPKTSVVNRYGQSWDIPNLFVIGSSSFPSMSGFNPTLTIQALAYMSADAIANRYKKHPGPLL
jgi:choline dehydrogenase-like flavoprotein